VQAVIEASAREVIEANGGDEVFRGMFSSVGTGPERQGPGASGRESGGHLVTVQIQLVGSGERDITSKQFAEAWSKATPEVSGVEALVFDSNFGPGAGSAVDLQLSHPDSDTLGEASVLLAEKLRSYTSLTDVENEWAAGKPQLNYHLTPEGSALGFTGNSLARQLRAAFFGAEAIREQRGRDEVRVMVRLPQEQRRSEYDLEELLVQSASGGLVPLEQVATFDRGHSPTQIGREDGARVVNVKADLAAGVSSSRDVLSSLEDEVYPVLKEQFPELTIAKVGASREQEEAFSSLALNGALALMVMFTLLAVPFKSYVQPLVVMAAIPMGVVGAVGGHVLMRYELSIISIFGLVALAGVVVNDSLVLIDATNRKRREGASATEAVVYGATRRLRPIVLTSLTTFFGLMPMIAETSVQARFLIPMAISLGFGVMFGTVVILFLVPAVYLIVEDVSLFAGRMMKMLSVPEEDSVVPQES
jgi:multidrug efflux pump subunit AcrB